MLLKRTYPLPPLGGVHILGAMPTYFTKTGTIVGSKVLRLQAPRGLHS